MTEKLKLLLNISHHDLSILLFLCKKSMSLVKDKRNLIIALLIVVIATAISMKPVLKNDFTNWDDEKYLLENELVRSLSADNITAIFFDKDKYKGSFVPLTIFSFAIEHHFVGYEPRVYHTTNYILHIINTLLVFWLIFLLTGRLEVAMICALLFGVHPMHVESVAWVAERKDVLYAVFFFLSLISYVYYLKSDADIKMLILSFLIFALALLSKSAAVPLPVVLILIDFLKRRKYNYKLIIEKIPFLLLAFLWGFITIFTVKSIAKAETLSIIQRIQVASYNFLVYIIKSVIPYKLSNFYSFPNYRQTFPLLFRITPFLIPVLLFLVYRTIKYTRVIIFGFLFFAFNIVLVLQFFPVGPTLMADRYTYVSYLGLFFIMAEGYSYLHRNNSMKRFKLTGQLLMVSMIIIFMFIAHERAKVWENSKILWSDVIQKFPQAEMAYKNRGLYFARKEHDYQKALEDYQVLMNMKTKDSEIYSNLGNIYGHMNKPQKAINAYKKAIKFDSNNANAYFNRGITYAKISQFDKALKDINKALEFEPGKTKILAQRAWIYQQAGKSSEAIEAYSQLIRKESGRQDYYYQRGYAYFNAGKYEDALKDFLVSLKLNPGRPATYYNISVVYFKQGKYNKAMKYAQQAREKGYNIPSHYLNTLNREIQKK